MSNIDFLKRQHREIAEIIENIENTIDNGNVQQESFDISMGIASLAGKLITHLNSEDQYLYPALDKHTNVKVKDTAKKFANEMGDLVYVFSKYKETYMSARNIKTDPQKFLDETIIIFNAIKKRVDAEEKDLYPLLQ